MRPGLLAVLLLCGCPGGGGTIPKPATEPSVTDVVDRLAKERDALRSFKATDNVMDYWFGTDRVKGKVHVMGEVPSKVRFNALNPAGGAVMADLACDGTNFVYLDYQHNCTLSGPCTKQSIANLLHVELEPDDFLHLALGTVPVVTDATGTVTWDGSKGYWRVALTSPQGTQKISIDARDKRWDVVDSELKRPDGTIVWSVENSDFHDAGGHRIPGKTRFKSPQQKEDLIVEWGTQEVNPQLDASKFAFAPPAGLGTCGQQSPTANRPANAPSGTSASGAATKTP
jgi:hypothetical protein